MNFLYPSFLFALSAIAIPIIIHLFNFRKFKTIYFSNVRFLKEVKQETQKKSKLKHLLVLLSRILAIIFLVLAFAQPYIPAENKNFTAGNKTVSIFIDNSFSMDAINKNGTLLDDAKKKALEIVSTYKPTDRFQILTNDFEGKHQRIVNKEEFSQLIDEIKISPASKKLNDVIARQADALNNSSEKNKSIFILSDFQKYFANVNEIKSDSNISINLVPVTANEKSNIYIDSCWFESPVRQINQIEKLHVLIKNKSNNDIENNAIKLYINNEQKTPASFNAPKNSDTEIILSYSLREPGIKHCYIEINDYPITFDDRFYFSYELSSNINVLSIESKEKNESAYYINKLFGSDSLFLFQHISENSIDYSSFLKQHLIILNELKSLSSGLSQELKRFISSGGSVLIFPANEIELNSYNDFLQSLNAGTITAVDTSKTQVSLINHDADIYKDVFDEKNTLNKNLNLPLVTKHYKLITKTTSREESLLKLQNGNPFLTKTVFEKGKAYICASGIQPLFGNFSKHALFVPTLYKIAIHSQANNPLFYTNGNNQVIETNAFIKGEDVFKIKALNNDFEIIPEHKSLNQQTFIYTHNQITIHGNYNLLLSNQIIKPLSYNYNRNESDQSYYNSDELQEEIRKTGNNNIKILSATEKSFNQLLMEKEQGKKLWKYCIILALIFLGVEILLLRFLKE